MTGNHPRIPCCVPFCRRGTRKWPDVTEIICGSHWRAIPLRYRKHKAAAERRVRRAEEQLAALETRAQVEIAERGTASPETFDRYTETATRRRRFARTANKAWERCKRIAVERAGGIG